MFYAFVGNVGLHAIFGPTCSQLKLDWGHVGPTLGLLGPILRHLGAILNHLGARLGPSSGYLGPAWGYLGAILGRRTLNVRRP